MKTYRLPRQLRQVLSQLLGTETGYLGSYPGFSRGCWGQKFQGSISLQLPGPEDLADFPVEWSRNLGRSSYLVLAKWGNQFPSILFVHSLDWALVAVKVQGSWLFPD